MYIMKLSARPYDIMKFTLKTTGGGCKTLSRRKSNAAHLILGHFSILILTKIVFFLYDINF